MTSGHYYQFRYRARNVHGDGPYSDPITILAATIPAKSSPPEVSIDTATAIYRITFAKPGSGGDSVPFTDFDV